MARVLYPTAQKSRQNAESDEGSIIGFSFFPGSVDFRE